MELKDLTPEQQAKLKAAQTPEEMLAVAQEAGAELTDEQLEQVAGGGVEWNKCGDAYCKGF